MAGETNQNTTPGGGSNITDFSDLYSTAQDFGFRTPFKGFSPSLSVYEQQQLEKLFNVRAEPYPEGARVRRQLQGGVYRYPSNFITQPALYDSEGRLAGKQYDFTDAYVVTRELNRLTTDQRIQISKELKRVGWYGNNEVSEAMMSGVGWSQTDEKVWAALLQTANNAQRPWQDMIGVISNWPTYKEAGPIIRVTSDEDAAAYTREVFLSQLGRMPTKAEMADAANFIRARERQAYGAGQQMPNTAVLAETFAQKADPQARTVYGLGNAIQLAFQALGQ
jgi:hypothetical protein